MEQCLQECYIYKDIPNVDLPANDMSYDVKRMLLLIEACQEGTLKDDVTNENLAQQLYTAAQSMKDDMTTNAQASESSDLKIHLLFFAACLDTIPNKYINPDEFENIIDQLVWKGANALK